ncbi:MAG: prepilin-type N-terminal cleavage/methylation domain-containing protein [Verrucomicrobiota bacterium]
MNSLQAKRKSSGNSGFTLAEVVIALGVVATLLTAFVVVFVYASDRIRETVDSFEADRLAAALERELSILREDEADEETRTAFAKAYRWIESSGAGEGSIILVYNYEGDPGIVREDGSLTPVSDTETDGEGFVVTPAVQFVGGGGLSDEIRRELEVASGPVFCVKLTQLVYDDTGKLIQGGSGIAFPFPDQEPIPGAENPSDAFPEPVIAVQADFYRLPTNSPDYISGLDTEELLRPEFSRLIGIRR